MAAPLTAIALLTVWAALAYLILTHDDTRPRPRP